MCLAEWLIILIVGFGKQSRICSYSTIDIFGYNLMVFNKMERVDAFLLPLIKRISM